MRRILLLVLLATAARAQPGGGGAPGQRGTQRIPASAASRAQIDSLRRVLARPKLPDTTRLSTLRVLSRWLFAVRDTASIRYAKRAAALAHQLGDHLTASRQMFNVVVFAENQDDLLTAQDYSWKGVAYTKAHALPNTWIFYQSLGMLAGDAKDYAACVGYLRLACREQGRTGEGGELRRGTLLFNLGNAFIGARRYDSAVYYAARAAPLLTARGDYRGQAILSLFRGIYNLRATPHTAEKLDSATAQFARALRTCEAMHDVGYGPDAAFGLAETYRLRGRATPSRAAAERGLRLAREAHSATNVQRGLDALAWAAEGQGQHYLAYALHNRALAIRDSLFNREKAAALATLQVRYNVQDQRRRLQLLAGRNRLVEAQAVATRARVGLLTQQNRAAAAQQQALRANLQLATEQRRAAEAESRNRRDRERYLLAERRAREQQLAAEQRERRSLWVLVGALVAALAAAGWVYGRLRRKSALLARANAANQRSAAEKEVLVQEIHHRVKNNLQLMDSLLAWQGRTLPDPALAPALANSRARLQSMALVHEFLYQADDLAQIRLDTYLKELLVSLHRTFSGPQGAVALSTDLAPFSMAAKEAGAFGLLVNELVTNVYKHAFGPSCAHAALHVALHRTAGGFRLRVVDNGVGPPPAGLGGPAAPHSLGMRLVALLAKQLNARVTAAAHHPAGTCVEVASA